MIRVTFHGLVKRYGAVRAVDEASFDLRPGALNGVLGPSGAGKTTLARLLAGLETPDDGEIYFEDRMVRDLPARERGLGVVFQDLGLWPGLTVAENVGYPLKMQGVSRAERRSRTAEALSSLRIDSLAGRRPEELSAARRTRVALARALAVRPRFLLLDAPLGGLGPPREREELWDELRRAHAEAGTTSLVLTDDPGEALALAEHLAVMDLGRIVQAGSPEELYNRPANVFVARLLGPTNLLQGQVESQAGDLARREVVVRTPLGRFVATTGAEGPGAGAPVTISMRPDTLAVAPAVPTGWNRFPATIETITFRGGLRQLQTRGPGDWPVRVSLPQSQSQGLRAGQNLTLSIAPEHVVVLPGKFALGGETPALAAPNAD